MSREKLREVVFHEGLRKIGEKAFWNCASLSSITLPSTVTEIGDGAFYNCDDLKVVEFNEGLQKIGVGAFWYCTSLESITLPATVTEVGSSSFDDCDGLRDVVLQSVPRKIGNDAFYNCTSVRFTFPTISTRLDNLIQTGHWEEIENKVNEVRGVVEIMSGGDLFVSTQTMTGVEIGTELETTWIKLLD